MGELAQDESAVPGKHPLLARALNLHKAGDLDAAAQMYLQISAEQPRNFDATHLLGVVALQQGRFETAQKIISAALAINPSDAMAMGNLGTAFMRDGKLDAALQWLELAHSVEPGSFNALLNLGTVLHNMGRYGEAVPFLRKSHANNPDSYLAANLLGACLLKTGQPNEAARIFETATAAEPDNAEGWANLSVAMHAIGKHALARDFAERAVSLKPESTSAHAALGAAQMDLGRLADAIESYKKGVAGTGTPSVDMLLSFGYVLLTAGRYEEATEQLQRALAIDGNNLPARWTCAMAHLKPIYTTEEELLESREKFAQAVEDVAAWQTTHAATGEPFDAVGANQPFYIAYQPFNNRALMSRYGEIVCSWMSKLPVQPESPVHSASPARPRTGGKIRLGIAAPYVREHSVWNAVTKGWVEHLDRNKFDIIIFQLKQDSDEQTEQAKRFAAHFEDRHSNYRDWAKAIKAQNLDVLIYPDVGMESLTIRLAALRLAPIQMTSWGHPETSGMPTVDYYLSGDAFEPPNAQENYSEKLVRLPNFGAYVEPLQPNIADPRLSALELPTNEPLLLCPGTPFKYTPLFDDVWVGIARRLRPRSMFKGGGGRLVFFRSRSDTMDRVLENRLRGAFDRGQVDFDAHVKIIPLLDRPKFFGLLQRSTLMLDTLGFSGFNTALQGIETTLPVLAYEGDFMRGRLASAILRKLDLPELVATSKEDFIDKAVDLAYDSGKRKRLRTLITARRDALFRDLTAIRALESFLIDTVDSHPG